jgi:hypothetical protein
MTTSPIQVLLSKDSRPASTGPSNASIDVAAAEERGIYVSTTGGYVESTVELTWALILAAARRIVDGNLSVRAGGWQTSVGRQLGVQCWVFSAWAGSVPGWRGSGRPSAWMSSRGAQT